MILTKLNLDEETSLEFSVEVFGTTENISKIAFVIENGEYNIELPIIKTPGGVEVKIPKLKGLIESGIKNCSVRVEIDGKIFYPLKEQIELNQLIEFDVKKKKIEVVKEGVKITSKNVVSEDSREVKSKMSGLEKNIQKAIKEGYEVSKVGENYIMKTGDSYIGIISEKSMLKSEQSFGTLSELIDELSK